MTKANSNQSLLSRNALFWLALVIGLLVFIYLIRSILLPFVMGMAIAYFLDPAADRLQKWGVSRSTSALAIVGVAFSVIILALIIVTPLVVTQLSEMLNAIPAYVAHVEQSLVPYVQQKLSVLSPDMMDEIKTSLTSSTGLIARTSAEFIGRLLTSGMAFVNVISLVLVTPIVAFYLLRDWDKIIAKLNELLPRSHAETIREQMRIINRTLSGFVRGQFNVCLFLGLYYAIGLTLVGLNFGFVIGLATGFLVIFPYVGLLLGAVVGLIVAFVQFNDVQPILMVLAVFVSGQVIEGNFVTPKLVGDKVGLHPAWIIFSILAGAALFGFVGVLLAVPFAAVIGVLTRFAIANYQKSSYYQ